MDRAEHYAEAERLIKAAESMIRRGADGHYAGQSFDTFHKNLESTLALAQVHATLANS